MSFKKRPQRNVYHTEPTCLQLFVKEKCRRGKSTHIYFIQIYIEFKYYISIRSFDTNLRRILLFLMVKMCIYSNGHIIITSIIQPLPSHPCLLSTVELQWQRPPASEFYIYIVKKTVIVYSGDRGEKKHWSRCGSRRAGKHGPNHRFILLAQWQHLLFFCRENKCMVVQCRNYKLWYDPIGTQYIFKHVWWLKNKKQMFETPNIRDCFVLRYLKFRQS